MIYNSPLLVASDHAGFELKQSLLEHKKHIQWKDLGTFDPKRTDYPDWAESLCQKLKAPLFGVLICGTGQGMSMKANTFYHVRAALCWNKNIARLARAHNNANVLCLPAGSLSLEQATQILETFLSTSFDDNPTYQKRVEDIKKTKAEII